jgi:hypothetical protein
MNDLSKISDEDLMKMLQGSGATPDLSKISDEDLMKLVSATAPDGGIDISDKIGDVAAGATGFARGATAGLSDVASSAVGAPFYAGLQKFVSGDERPMSELLKEGYSGTAGQIKKLREDHPKSSFAGELTGMFAPGPLNVGAGLLKGASAIGKAATGARELGLLGRIAMGAATVGGSGAATSGVENVSSALTGGASGGQVDLGSSAKWGAGIGAALPASGAVARRVGRFAVGQMASATSTSRPFVETFLSKGSEILKAPTERQFSQKVTDLYHASGENKDGIIDSFKGLISEASKGQVKLTSNLSSEAYAILDLPENAGKTINKKSLYKPLKDLFDKSSIAGTRLGTPVAKATTKDVLQWKAALDALPNDVSLSEAKKLLQAISAEKSDLFANHETRGKPIVKALESIYTSLNSKLKAQSDAYRSFMETTVEPATKFSIELGNIAKSPSKVNAFMNRLTKELSRSDERLRISKNPELSKISSIVAPIESDADMLAGTKKYGYNVPPEPKTGLDQRFIDDIYDLRRSVIGSSGSEETLNRRLEKMYKTFMSPSEGTIELKTKLEALSNLKDGALTQLAEEVSMRSRFENISVTPDSLTREIFGWSGAGVAAGGVVTAAGSVTTGSVMIALGLVKAFGPVVAKRVMKSIAMANGMPTVKMIKAMDIPEKAKEQLISGLVNYVNSAGPSSDPVKITDINQGKQIQGFIREGKDPVAMAHHLTQLHKKQEIDPKVIADFIISGGKTVPAGGLAGYFERANGRGDSGPVSHEASGPVYNVSDEHPFFQALIKAEGTDRNLGPDGVATPYDEVLGYGKYGSPPKPVSQMTIQEAYDFGTQMRRNPKNKTNSSAIGAFQIVGSNLKEAVEKWGFKPTDLFDAEAQRKIATKLAARSDLASTWEGLQYNKRLLGDAKKSVKDLLNKK